MAYLFDSGNPAISVGLGPQVTFPSATEDVLGSEQWSLGLAQVTFVATDPKVQRAACAGRSACAGLALLGLSRPRRLRRVSGLFGSVSHIQ